MVHLKTHFKKGLILIYLVSFLNIPHLFILENKTSKLSDNISSYTLQLYTFKNVFSYFNH